jgi:hypothetical protein
MQGVNDGGCPAQKVLFFEEKAFKSTVSIRVSRALERHLFLSLVPLDVAVMASEV